MFYGTKGRFFSVILIGMVVLGLNCAPGSTSVSVGVGVGYGYPGPWVGPPYPGGTIWVGRPYPPTYYPFKNKHPKSLDLARMSPKNDL